MHKTGCAISEQINNTIEGSKRINDLDKILDEDINLSMFFPVDTTEETFKTDFKQLIDYIEKHLINGKILVGDIIQTINKLTPNERGYTGKWEKLPLNLYLSTGDNIGVAQGDNNIKIPVAIHSHGAMFTGKEMGKHGHSTYGGAYNENVGHNSGGATNKLNVHFETDEVSAGTPDGDVLVEEAGEKDVTIDVRGSRFDVYSWIKREM